MSYSQESEKSFGIYFFARISLILFSFYFTVICYFSIIRF